MSPRALTIAGSDSGGGAGVQADIKTFTALRCHAMCALTAVTAQNTVGVAAVHDVPPEVVRAQIEAVVSDIGVDAAKTGMLASAATVEAVAGEVRRLAIPNLVVDPVMVASSGARLLKQEAVEALKALLVPAAVVLTPNRPEAAALLGRALGDDEPPEETAIELAALGPRWVLLKGGHAKAEAAVDVLTDGVHTLRYTAPWIETPHTHGSGCVLSAAIAAHLAHGRAVADAVRDAKAFVHASIEHHLEIGAGVSPVDPAWQIR